MKYGEAGLMEAIRENLAEAASTCAATPIASNKLRAAQR